jgi:hypothetical protein
MLLRRRLKVDYHDVGVTYHSLCEDRLTAPYVGASITLALVPT